MRWRCNSELKAGFQPSCNPLRSFTCRSTLSIPSASFIHRYHLFSLYPTPSSPAELRSGVNPIYGEKLPARNVGIPALQNKLGFKRKRKENGMRLHTKCVVRRYMMNINNRQQTITNGVIFIGCWPIR